MTATITPPERGMARVTAQDIADAHDIAPAVMRALYAAILREIAPPIFTEPVALELAKLVRKDWLNSGIHIAGHTDWSDVVDGEPAEWIEVEVGVPTDGPRFQRGRGYALAEAIGNVRPVCEVANG